MEMLENDDLSGTSMEDRVSNLETIAQLSVRLHGMMLESLRREQEERRQMDEVMQQMLRLIATMQADIVRIDETHS